jgi:predicted nucleic acid-binding protein
MSQLVILDNEAVQALRAPAHPKHNQVLSYIQVVANRKKRAIPVSLAVPTAVRAEAGWDRTSAAWAFPNHLRIADIPLDAGHANTAAVIRDDTGVSVADAHIGAAVEGSPNVDITVITSDPHDIRKVAGDRTITVVTI